MMEGGREGHFGRGVKSERENSVLDGGARKALGEGCRVKERVLDGGGREDLEYACSAKEKAGCWMMVEGLGGFGRGLQSEREGFGWWEGGREALEEACLHATP